MCSLKKILRLFLIIAGVALGPGIVMLFYAWATLLIYVISGVISGIIFYFLSRRIVDGLDELADKAAASVAQFSPRVLLFGLLGTVSGVLVSLLLLWPIRLIQILWIAVPLEVMAVLISIYLFSKISIKHGPRIIAYMKEQRRERRGEGDDEPYASSPKILDTSVIIDGRIFDICKTGIIEGVIVIPEFVLGELRHIADSADSLKRGKGRRGLDILSKIQKELKLPVEITNVDYDDVAEVDAKLLRLAKDMGGKVITNDFNLNKVAAVQGVAVLNINDIANAVKPVLLPGEELFVTIIKEGKESGQGVAYLEDGTMIVVENARARVGESFEVVVTSVLQTSAGRMIFAKPKGK